MAFHAQNLGNGTDAGFQVKRVTLTGTSKSCNMPATTLMIGHPPHTSLPSTQVMKSYSTIDNTQIQPSMSIAMVPTMVPPQTVVSAHSTAMNPVTVPATSAGIGLQQVGHLIIQSPKLEEGQRDHERKIRREIANSNERRRMQSINAGFKSLKTILPHTDGEKLSKAAILQQTSEYITQLESDKLKLVHQNEKLRRAFADCKCNSPKHRAIVCDIFDKDEGIGSPAEEDFEDMRRGIIEVRQQLDKERRMRMHYEEQIRNLEAQLYPDKLPLAKVNPLQRSSSDEPSDYSPSSTKQEVNVFSSSKLQTCARPLLPPLTPLMSKINTEPVTHPTQVAAGKQFINTPIYGKRVETGLSEAGQHTITAVSLNEISSEGITFPKESEEKLNKPGTHTELPQGHAVTVFSHSTKSNQPLKKRAIEIQNFAGYVDQVPIQQPKCKVAKISVDHPPGIGTRSFLPSTLPPISLATLKMQSPMLSPRPLAQQVARTTSTFPAQSKTTITLYPQPVSSAPALLSSVPSSVTLTTTPSSNSASLLACPVVYRKNVEGVQDSNQVTLMAPLPMQTVMKPIGESKSVGSCVAGPSSQAEIVAVKPALPPGIAGQITQEPKAHEIYAVVHSDYSSPANTARPMYLTMGGFQPQAIANSGPSMQPLGKPNFECVASTPPALQSHLVVTPVSIDHNSGAMLLNNKAHPGPSLQMGFKQLSDPVASSKVDQAGINHQEIGSRSFNPPATLIRSEVRCEAEIQATQCGPAQAPCLVQAQTFHCSSVAKLQNSLNKIQNQIQQPTQQTAVLCYRPPEITLNQLNAVPNLLPPPRSLHQPILLPTPSLVQHLNSSSPSYISPVLQDNVLQPRFSNFAQARRRKSSTSATDSCSTASISEVEEEDIKNPLLDDPDCQSEDSVPTIKLCSSEPPASPRRKISQHSLPETVAAYNEVPHDGNVTPEKVDDSSKYIDVPESGCRSPATSTNATLSVLSNVAGSPPVIRRIDAIQTRRNLETIVQAIDHLEQQERRNSQDHSNASPVSPPSSQPKQ